jgi:hypothetical protein
LLKIQRRKASVILFNPWLLARLPAVVDIQNDELSQQGRAL